MSVPALHTETKPTQGFCCQSLLFLTHHSSFLFIHPFPSSFQPFQKKKVLFIEHIF